MVYPVDLDNLKLICNKIFRMSTARDRSDQADFHAQTAMSDADLARIHAKQFDPNFAIGR
jgi:hypothetical protein